MSKRNKNDSATASITNGYDHEVGASDWWKNMKNDCFACRKPIPFQDIIDQVQAAIQRNDLDHLHIHYCRKCIKFCAGCGNPKPIWGFRYDQNSPGYKEWKDSGMRGPLPARRDAYSDICAWCERDIRKINEEEARRRKQEAREQFLTSPATKSLLDLMGYGRDG